MIISIMTQNTTSSVMSTYEKYSLYISVIAIVISIIVPLLQWIYRKTKRLKLAVIPFESNPLSLLFNEAGSYFRLMFCIQCENQDTIITSIDATLSRKTDCWEKTYKWSIIETTCINWVGSSFENRLHSGRYAHPYKIKADTLEPFIIEFSNQKDVIELISKCETNAEKLFQFINFNSYLNTNELKQSIANIKYAYKKTEDYSSMYNSLQQYFYWKPGSYFLNLSIHYGVGKCKDYSFSFEISEEEFQLFSKNYEEINFGRLHQNYQLPINLNVLNKSLKTIDRGSQNLKKIFKGCLCDFIKGFSE